MNEVVQIISTLGFPIAMCVFFCWYVVNSNEKTSTILNQMNETLAVIKEYIQKGD